MTREMKFRAWTGSKMIDNFKLIDLASGPGTYTVTTPEMTYALVDLMQYTGLKDQNGADIYDGDILRCRYLYVVVWVESAARFIAQRVTPDSTGKSITACASRGHIVGNIYENPELLSGASL